MANFKVSEDEKRIMNSFSIRVKTLRIMKNYCLENNLSFSKIIDDLLTDFIIKNKIE